MKAKSTCSICGYSVIWSSTNRKPYWDFCQNHGENGKEHGFIDSIKRWLSQKVK